MKTTKMCALWLIICIGCEDIVRSNSVLTPVGSKTQDTTSGLARSGLLILDNVILRMLHFDKACSYGNVEDNEGIAGNS